MILIFKKPLRSLTFSDPPHHSWYSSFLLFLAHGYDTPLSLFWDVFLFFEFLCVFTKHICIYIHIKVCMSLYTYMLVHTLMNIHDVRGVFCAKTRLLQSLCPERSRLLALSTFPPDTRSFCPVDRVTRLSSDRLRLLGGWPSLPSAPIIDGVALPASNKWGHTEIAERGRSVLVMRARYRSAGLTPHQRGRTDAG